MATTNPRPQQLPLSCLLLPCTLATVAILMLTRVRIKKCFVLSQFCDLSDLYSSADVALDGRICYSPVERSVAHGEIARVNWFAGSDGLEIGDGIELYEYQGIPNVLKSANSGRWFVF